MSRGLRAALGLAIAAALIVAGAGWLAWRARAGAAEPVPVDPELEPYLPLRTGDRRDVVVTWNRGPSATLVREVTGWEQVQGAPHARVEWWAARRRRKREVYLVEWLRPARTERGAASVVCSQRQVGPHLQVLAPPQPVLVAPVEAGSAWTWSGLAGESPARAAFRIEPPTGEGTWPDALSVVEEVALEPSTSSAGHAPDSAAADSAPGDSAALPLTATRIRLFVAGRGAVAETGEFPAQEGEGGGRMRLEAYPPAEPAGP